MIDRYISTKDTAHLLTEETEGIPIEEARPGIKIPDSLKGAKVYRINGREIVALPEQLTED